MNKEIKKFEFPSGWLLQQPDFVRAMQTDYSDHLLNRDGIKRYFDIYNDKPALLSLLPKVVIEAVNVQIRNGKFISQLTLDHDEVIYQVKKGEPLDQGEYYSNGDRF